MSGGNLRWSDRLVELLKFCGDVVLLERRVLAGLVLLSLLSALGLQWFSPVVNQIAEGWVTDVGSASLYWVIQCVALFFWAVALGRLFNRKHPAAWLQRVPVPESYFRLAPFFLILAFGLAQAIFSWPIWDFAHQSLAYPFAWLWLGFPAGTFLIVRSFRSSVSGVAAAGVFCVLVGELVSRAFKAFYEAGGQLHWGPWNLLTQVPAVEWLCLAATIALLAAFEQAGGLRSKGWGRAVAVCVAISALCSVVIALGQSRDPLYRKLQSTPSFWKERNEACLRFKADYDGLKIPDSMDPLTSLTEFDRALSLLERYSSLPDNPGSLSAIYSELGEDEVPKLSGVLATYDVRTCSPMAFLGLSRRLVMSFGASFLHDAERERARIALKNALRSFARNGDNVIEMMIGTAILGLLAEQKFLPEGMSQVSLAFAREAEEFKKTHFAGKPFNSIINKQRRVPSAESLRRVGAQVKFEAQSARKFLDRLEGILQGWT